MSNFCECCNRYWTHLHGKVKCFVTHMDRHSRHIMVIPESFVYYFEWKLSGTIELEAPNGNVYDVGITERRNKTVLQSGWEAFVDANHIVKRDSLMFRYRGNRRFEVMVFNSSGCEKVVSCTARIQSNINDQERSTNSTDISTGFSYGNNHLLARRSDDCQTGRSGYCRKRARKDAISSRSEDLSEDSLCEHESSESEDIERIRIRPEQDDTHPYIMTRYARLTQLQKKKVLKKVEVIASDLHIYVAVITRASVLGSLTFATQYCDTYLRKGSRSLVFQTKGKRQQWHGELHDNNRALRITGGWTSFAKDNNLRNGDICLFELMKNNGGLKKMMVYIIRRESC